MHGVLESSIPQVQCPPQLSTVHSMEVTNWTTLSEHRKRERMENRLSSSILPHGDTWPPQTSPQVFFDIYEPEYASDYPQMSIYAPADAYFPKETFSRGKQSAYEGEPLEPFSPSPIVQYGMASPLSPLPSLRQWYQAQDSRSETDSPQQSSDTSFDDYYDFEYCKTLKEMIIESMDASEMVARKERAHMPDSLKNAFLASKAVSTAMNQLETVVPSKIALHQRCEYPNVYWALVRPETCLWRVRPWVPSRKNDKLIWITFDRPQRPLGDHVKIDPQEDPSRMGPFNISSSKTSLFESPTAPYTPLNLRSTPTSRRSSVSSKRELWVAPDDHPMRFMKPEPSPRWKYVRLMGRKRRFAHATNGRCLSELVAAAVYYRLPLRPSLVKSKRHLPLIAMKVPPPPPCSTPVSPASNADPTESELKVEGADSPRTLFRSQEVCRSGGPESSGPPIAYTMPSQNRTPLTKGYNTPSGTTRPERAASKRSTSLRLSSPQRQTSQQAPPPRSGTTIASMSSPKHTLRKEVTPTLKHKPVKVVGHVEVEEPETISPLKGTTFSIEVIDTILSSEVISSGAMSDSQSTGTSSEGDQMTTPAPDVGDFSYSIGLPVTERVKRYESTHILRQGDLNGSGRATSV